MMLMIELPAELEARLRAGASDLNADAKEAMFVEFYRQEKLTRYELSQALGLSRMETDALLKKHKVTEDLPTAAELEEDFQRGMDLVGR